MIRGAGVLHLVALVAGFAAVSAALPQAPAKNPQQKPQKKDPGKQTSRPSALEKLQQDAYDALNREDFQAAADLFTKFLLERPGDAVAHFQLGYSLTALTRREDAEAEYRTAITLDPKMGAAYMNLGLLLKAKDRVAAEVPLVKAAELLPANAEAQYLAGSTLRDNGKDTAAEPLLRKAVEMENANPEYHFALADFLFGRQRLTEAEAEFRTTLKLRPGDAASHARLGEILLRKKRPAEGADELAAAIQADPKKVDFLRLQLATVYGELGRFDEAYAQLDAMSADQGVSAEADDLRADLLIHQKRHADAVVVLRRILERSPKDPQAHARLGHALLEMRDFPGAQRELLAALEVDGKLTEALRDLMSAYFLAEDYPRALKALDMLAERETPNAPAWFVRAICYDKLRRKPEALAAYQKFIELDGGRDADQNFQARQRIRILRHELKK